MEALTYPYISLVLRENELNIDGYLWTSLLILRLGLKGKSIKFESRLASIEILTQPQISLGVKTKISWKQIDISWNPFLSMDFVKI